jgi:Spy/CpxP family protein refolding chaperone
MKPIAIRLAPLLVLLAHAALGQSQPGPNADPVGEQIFPPELILQYQMAINLTDTQRDALVAEVKGVQGTLFERQADLQRRVEVLIGLLKPDRVNEQQVLAQLDEVLTAEREIKRQHISLAVRLKNLLTPSQMRQLRELRRMAAERK